MKQLMAEVYRTTVSCKGKIDQSSCEIALQKERRRRDLLQQSSKPVKGIEHIVRTQCTVLYCTLRY